VTSYRGRCRTCPRSPTIPLLSGLPVRCSMVTIFISSRRVSTSCASMLASRDRCRRRYTAAHSTEMVGAPRRVANCYSPPSSSGVPAPVTIAGVSLADDGRICESYQGSCWTSFHRALVTVGASSTTANPGRSVSLAGYRSSCRNSKTSPGAVATDSANSPSLRLRPSARVRRLHLALDDHHLDRRRPPRAPARIQRRRLPTDRAHGCVSRKLPRASISATEVFQKA